MHHTQLDYVTEWPPPHPPPLRPFYFHIRPEVTLCSKLQALVYDILPPTTAIVDYAIALEKLSANEQFFDDAQTAIRFSLTTQIISDVSSITDHVAYASTNKTKIV